MHAPLAAAQDLRLLMSMKEFHLDLRFVANGAWRSERSRLIDRGTMILRPSGYALNKRSTGAT